MSLHRPLTREMQDAATADMARRINGICAASEGWAVAALIAALAPRLGNHSADALRALGSIHDAEDQDETRAAAVELSDAAAEIWREA